MNPNQPAAPAPVESDLSRSRRRPEPPFVDLSKIDRLPPHSVEAEQGVLGCCLLDPVEGLADVRAKIRSARVFYDGRHQDIYEHLCALVDARITPDLLTLSQRLKDANCLEQVGGLPYLSALPDAVPSAANLPHYLDIVWQKYLRRRLVAAATEMVGRAFADEGATTELLNEAEVNLLAVGDEATGGDTGTVTMQAAVGRACTEFFDTFRRGVKRMQGPPTGFNYIDNTLQGLAPGFFVLAARPSTGKSALGWQIAENVAGLGHDPLVHASGTPVGVFSLEMSAMSLTKRGIFQRGKGELRRFNNGFATDAEIQSLSEAGGQLAHLPIFIDDRSDVAIEDLGPRMRRMMRRHGCKLFVIDYLQLLRSRKMAHRQSRVDEMAEVSTQLKALSKQLHLPIIACAQLNRDFEKEPGRKPRLSDLKDCGQIEQDADVVMFLYEPKLNEEQTEEEVRQNLPPNAMRFLERAPVPAFWRKPDGWRHYLKRVNCLVAKNREGEAGVDCALLFVRKWCRFFDAWNPERDRQIQAEESDTGTPEEPKQREMDEEL